MLSVNGLVSSDGSPSGLAVCFPKRELWLCGHLSLVVTVLPPGVSLTYLQSHHPRANSWAATCVISLSAAFLVLGDLTGAALHVCQYLGLQSALPPLLCSNHSCSVILPVDPAIILRCF